MPEIPTASCPVDECKLAVDIVLKSSDGELFGAHQRNLEIYTEGFPIAGSTIVSEPVSLEESSEVLGLMLRYTHHIRQPSLDCISFILLASLAEAVEKYMIYSAMEVCKLKMALSTSDYPKEVFMYAAKHNYSELADKAAKLTLKNPSSEFLVLLQEASFSNDIAFRWLRYRDRWMEVLVQLVLTEPTFQSTLHKGGYETCPAWPPFQFGVIKDVSQDPSVLEEFQHTVSSHQGKLSGCTICRLRSDRWATLVMAGVRELPKYSEV